jgi:hypothetical protein
MSRPARWCCCTRGNSSQSQSCLRPLIDARRHKFYPQFHETDFRLQEPRALIGIDPCPIEGFNHENAEAVLSEAGLLEDGRFGLAVMVAFGYRVNPQPVKTRQAMEKVVRWI